MWQPTFDQVFKILTAAGGFGTFVWTVYTWRAKSLDDQAAARADAEKARKTRQIEATKPFLDRQLQIYSDITQFAAAIAAAEDAGSRNQFAPEFWRLYYGQMALVENPEVEAAMVEFGKVLKTTQDRQELQRLALALAGACRGSLDRSWGIHAWTAPDKAADN
jgi:hypothetical protein